MRCLKKIELSGFKSFAKKTAFFFETPITAIVGPNGSGKSNVAEAFRWALGEQSMKSLRGKKGEDLIFNGSASLPRMSRASVSLTFDNTQKIFDVPFEEVEVRREVFRDGQNNYFINDSLVRLRDVVELLSAVSLGASSHHIISQGEADRILSASAKDRRMMVEDALGLRIYHWRIAEAKKKLLATEENMKEVQVQRREISGHLRFLKKEVERAERVRELREKLYRLYKDYLPDQKRALLLKREKIQEEEREARDEIQRVKKELDSLAASPDINRDHADDSEGKRLNDAWDRLLNEENSLVRRLGQIEGFLLAHNNDTKKKRYVDDDVERFLYRLESTLGRAEKNVEIHELEQIIQEIRQLCQEFKSVSGNSEDKDVRKYKEERDGIRIRLEELARRKSELARRKEEFYQRKRKAEEEERARHKKFFEMKEKDVALRGRYERIKDSLDATMREEEDLKRELADTFHYVGRQFFEELGREFVEAHGYTHFGDDAREQWRKDIQRLKILIDEAGAPNQDLIQEYHDILERDRFLEGELKDLERGKESLRELISDLEHTLSEEFKKGVAAINKEFTKFFELMFGGGRASLKVVEVGKKREIDTVVPFAAADSEEGLEVHVSLPRKKVRGLDMLSGGERALTSIALLFALSQVKPPPFLILDETDAALDEANSRKYGDMIESLAKRTQLILITHNRETMSRAGVLYGVTMGSDGVSTVLTVKFDDAVKIAK